jgi:hypothetical protein
VTVFFWYIGLSVLGVAVVFQSRGIDYRLIAVGSMIPLIVDIPFGYRAYGYTLLFAVVLLLAATAGTIGRPRLVRRRLVCLPIGVLCGLVLSGAFLDRDLFWWPLFGTSFAHHSLLPATWAVVAEEIVGLVAIWVVVGLYDLYLPHARRELWRTGRMTRVS